MQASARIPERGATPVGVRERSDPAAGLAPGVPLLPLALIAAFAGLYAAAVLSAGHLLDLPVPCGGSRGCAAVAAHPSSEIFGVPIAYGGVAAYAAIVLLLQQAPRSRLARRVLVALTAVGTLASAALLVHARNAIGATCPWCVASAAAMAATLVSSVAILLRGRGGALRPANATFAWGLALLVAAGIGLQGGLMQRAAGAPPIEAARLRGVGADVLVDPAKSLGPPDAAVTVVAFVDLLCPACRAAHRDLLAYQGAHPSGVRLVYRHVPLWGLRGHESSGAAAALSELAAEQGLFWEFVEGLHGLAALPSREDFLQLATSLGIDPRAAEARVLDERDPAVVRVWRDVELAERLGIATTPTFVVLLDDGQVRAARQRTLPRLLASPPVVARLLAARGGR